MNNELKTRYETISNGLLTEVARVASHQIAFGHQKNELWLVTTGTRKYDTAVSVLRDRGFKLTSKFNLKKIA